VDQTESKLAKCFAALFPKLNADEIPLASQENVSEWDSLASLTLMGLIEEEFGRTLDYEDLESLTSFGAIVEYLERAEGKIARAA